jgi:hypothetical protein
LPIDVDASEAPAFLRWFVRGEWPSIAEMGEVRARLIANGQLTAETRALFDLRNVETVPGYHEVAPMIVAAMKSGGWPRHRGYIVGSALQCGLVQQMQALAPPEIHVEVFFNQLDANQWLRSQPR